MQSIALAMFLEPFKAAAAEGAVVELKMRLLAASIPKLQQHALDRFMENIEAKLAEHFDSSLSIEEKDTFRLCRQLRNKLLHADFHAAREKLDELGITIASGGVTKVDIPVVSVAESAKKIVGIKAGTEGTLVSDTSSTALGTVYGWFCDAGNAGDFQKAANAFKGAAVIIDRLAGLADLDKA
jgi:hypothetical protein